MIDNEMLELFLFQAVRVLVKCEVRVQTLQNCDLGSIGLVEPLHDLCKRHFKLILQCAGTIHEYHAITIRAENHSKALQSF